MCLKNKKVGKIGRLLHFIRSFLSTASSCLLSAITRQKNVPFTTGIRVDGRKDILGLWIQDSESKHAWMQIFDELKSRGVQEVGFISMEVVQRCIVHLIRNSLKYVPTRDYKVFTAHLKKIYGAPSLKASRVEFERFCQVWAKYPGAKAVWKRCFAYVEQLFDYPSAVRKCH